MDEEYHELVLDVVESIPAGRVMTYGAIATVVGQTLQRGGPRQVGAVLRAMGGAVPWWRVVNAAGQPPLHKRSVALERLRAEGCPLTPDGGRVPLAVAHVAMRSTPVDMTDTKPAPAPAPDRL